MRVLVVEDDHTIAQAIRRGLEQESFAVDVAYDGEEGYINAINEEYDLIILDVLLPNMSGVEVARKLREESIHTRVLMLSAKSQIPDKIDGLDSGADDYMIKPFSFEELLARINALLRRPHEQQGNILQAADLSLDTVAREVHRGGRLISLSATEFALLEYLLRNKGRVLSKQSIIAHVWDFDADVIPHTVETFIAFLRVKVDKPFPEPELIQTVRGFGYKIDTKT